MKLLRWRLVLLFALELITVTHYFTEWLTRTWISYSVYKTEQLELFMVLEVSTHLFHRNFVTCIGYPCAPRSSLYCQHCVFDHERWTSPNTFLTHYTHTNQRACSIHQLKTCWLYLVVKLCLAVVDFRLLHLECGTVYHKNFETVKL